MFLDSLKWVIFLNFNIIKMLHYTYLCIRVFPYHRLLVWANARVIQEVNYTKSPDRF